MSLASLAQGQAASAINRYGAPGTLTRSTPGAFDPATGIAAPTVTTCPCKALLDASRLQGLGYTFGQGMVQSGDIKATIPAKGLTFTPAPGDTLAVIGKTYAILAVRPLFVGAEAVTHECLVRA